MFYQYYTMEEKRILEIKEKVASMLDQRRLKKAIDILGENIEELQDWALQTAFTQMQTSYKYLLEYFCNGVADPEREKMRTRLMGECYMINDLIAASRQAEHSLSVYNQHKRKYRNLNNITPLHTRLKENHANTKVTNSLPKEECRTITEKLQKEHEQILDEIFATTWSSTAWSKGEQECIAAIINDKEIATNDRALLVSAVTLSALKCFEPTKALLLLGLAQSDEIIISTRALIGALLTLHAYGNRIKYYPEVAAAITALCDNETMLKRIETVQIQLLRCRETQKIDRKMREEIIPAMLKNPQLHSEKMGMDIMREIEEDEEKNPEWKKWVEKDEIKEKIEEMAKWQFEGADVYMSTFSQLKNYPFFNEIKNWLRPFDTAVPEIAAMMPHNKELKNTMLGAICASRFFCNSDKYSFCLTFKQVPEAQRDMLMQQISAEGDIAEQGPDTTAVAANDKEAESTGNQYIQDLYRFFKLSHFRLEFDDPFSHSLNLLNCEALQGTVSTPQALLRMFEHLLDKGYYSEAVETGKIYEKSQETGEQFYQKLGFCLQKEKEYKAAIDYYTRADIIRPDTLWTLRHIAQCYRLLGEPEKALAFYMLAEEIAPEDLSLLRQTAECMTTLKRYDEAMSRFFKIEYIKPGSINILRAIAWCSFLTKKDSQAQHYYSKIMEMPKALFTDYMNAAHVEWATGNNNAATSLYSKAKEMGGYEALIASMEKDRTTLQERGISNAEIDMLIDMIDK